MHLQHEEVDAQGDDPSNPSGTDNAVRGLPTLKDQTQHQRRRNEGHDPTARISPAQPDLRRVDVEIAAAHTRMSETANMTLL